jgi:hypothetical protein
MTLAVLVLASLAAGGCQYSFPVKAVRQGDVHVLQARGGGGRFAPKACIHSLAVRQAGQTIWEIRDARPGWQGMCGKDFPLVYGRAPDGFETVVPARPLEPGASYTIHGGGYAGLYGAFSVNGDLTVKNEKGAEARRLGR